jgi:hypothetical protein
MLYAPLTSPICATCPAHLIPLALITLTILGEEYKPCSSSLCNFLQPPVKNVFIIWKQHTTAQTEKLINTKKMWAYNEIMRPENIMAYMFITLRCTLST